MLVSLEVCFQVIFGESFIDLGDFGIPGQWWGDGSPHLCKRIFFIGVFVPKLMKTR